MYQSLAPSGPADTAADRQDEAVGMPARQAATQEADHVLAAWAVPAPGAVDEGCARQGFFATEEAFDELTDALRLARENGVATPKDGVASLEDRGAS
ncbi:hypothetical protein ACPC54_24940 [Kitasatospora sp. NPDC094028]